MLPIQHQSEDYDYDDRVTYLDSLCSDCDCCGGVEKSGWWSGDVQCGVEKAQRRREL
ncbi:hypothetical protein TSUD_122850 [Trifolium subterraneum]|uniref:Uncharacterized protein n=1 Tax=Trifolium subterraneum TaxID=3900 RepID=A0A2Z6MU05_TRISU|nr:hypothetical protein TSUD_122850 [Trifolium subterraneum]